MKKKLERGENQAFLDSNYYVKKYENSQQNFNKSKNLVDDDYKYHTFTYGDGTKSTYDIERKNPLGEGKGNPILQSSGLEKNLKTTTNQKWYEDCRERYGPEHRELNINNSSNMMGFHQNLGRE